MYSLTIYAHLYALLYYTILYYAIIYILICIHLYILINQDHQPPTKIFHQQNAASFLTRLINLSVRVRVSCIYIHTYITIHTIIIMYTMYTSLNYVILLYAYIYTYVAHDAASVSSMLHLLLKTRVSCADTHR